MSKNVEVSRTITRVSDISGEDIEKGEGAVVRVTFDDKDRSFYLLDLTAEEGNELADKGTESKRRPRKSSGESEVIDGQESIDDGVNPEF